MPKEIINGVEIYYELNGNGEDTVVMLNGMIMSTADWYEFVPLYTKEFRLLRVDFRNQGKSQYIDEDILVDIHADDLKVLFDKLNIDKVHMIGTSYGGEVAMIFALKYQNMLKSLVLSNTVARVTKHLESIINAWEEAARLYDGRKFFKLVMPLIYSAEFYESHWQWMLNREKAFGRILKKTWFDGFLKLTGSIRSYDILDEIHQIKVPTLCIAGNKDFITPLSEVQMIHNSIEKSSLFIISGAGHASFYEKTEEFNKTVLSFLKAQVY